MKKHIIARRCENKLTKTILRELRERCRAGRLTIGLDLGDRSIHYCVLDEQGEIWIEDTLPTTRTGLNQLFENLPRTRVVMEAGTHSPWASRHLSGLGHEVLVANPRKMSLITESRRKNDRADAEKLARVGRADPKLLFPIRHRQEDAQRDLAEIRLREALVQSRTKVINAARGMIKSFGYRLESSDCDQVDEELAARLPEEWRALVKPLLATAAYLTTQIKVADQRIHAVAQRYPEIGLLTAIYGVGELTALAFVLTIEDAERFGKSREVGPYLGVVPGQAQSGDRDPQQRITKEGDRMVRWLLVQSAHCILRHGAPDSNLRRWGLAKIEEANTEQQKRRNGKKRGKKRVLVAVARKLAVLMHHLWANGEVYDPLYGARPSAASAAPVMPRKRAGKVAA